MSLRWASGVVGVVLILAGIVLPREWYDALPKREGLAEPPFKGVTLLQICLVIDGLLLIAVSVRGWTFSRLESDERLVVPDPGKNSETFDMGRLWVPYLIAATLLALALRFYRLDSDLWIDEITTTLYYRDSSVLEVLTAYINSNNHLLNTLLMKLSIALFGESEWALRLPAAIFGVATVPAIYWFSRSTFSKWASLAVALLLAVSYHHIFFSQNARGYSAYLFFSLLSSGFLIRALQSDNPRDWVLYVLTSVLNFAAMLHSGFVFAGHILVSGLAILAVRRRGGGGVGLFRRVAGVFSLTVLLGLNLYASIIPQVMVFVSDIYRQKSSGFQALSVEFIQEIIRGTTVGFSPGLLLGAVPFLLVAALGLFLMTRRLWLLPLTLLIPTALIALYVVARGLTVSPRFFLLGLPLAIICAVAGMIGVAGGVGKVLNKSATATAAISVTLILLVSAASMASLRPYYANPKQNYRGAIGYLEEIRRPGDVVVPIYLADWGYLYYGEQWGLESGRDYFSIRSMEAFEAILADHCPDRVFLVTTFHRGLRLDFPEIYERIEREWEVIRTFPGTMGDGAVSIWRYRGPDG